MHITKYLACSCEQQSNGSLINNVFVSFLFLWLANGGKAGDGGSTLLGTAGNGGHGLYNGTGGHGGSALVGKAGDGGDGLHGGDGGSVGIGQAGQAGRGSNGGQNGKNGAVIIAPF